MTEALHWCFVVSQLLEADVEERGVKYHCQVECIAAEAEEGQDMEEQ